MNGQGLRVRFMLLVSVGMFLGACAPCARYDFPVVGIALLWSCVSRESFKPHVHACTNENLQWYRYRYRYRYR